MADMTAFFHMLLLDWMGDPESSWVIRILVNALSLYAASRILKGVHVHSAGSALVVALVLTLVNGSLGVILKFLLLPFNLLSLGLVGLVINAIVIMVTDYFLSGFRVLSFFWAFLLGILMAVLNHLLFQFL